MSSYREVIIETFSNHGESTDAKVRARPVEGQGYDTNMRVECSRSMRKNHPVGTKFKLLAKVSSRQGGKEFLYSPVNAKYKVINSKE